MIADPMRQSYSVKRGKEHEMPKVTKGDLRKGKWLIGFAPGILAVLAFSVGLTVVVATSGAQEVVIRKPANDPCYMWQLCGPSFGRSGADSAGTGGGGGGGGNGGGGNDGGGGNPGKGSERSDGKGQNDGKGNSQKG
jgi:uncharacterized membrane protein YgcG